MPRRSPGVLRVFWMGQHVIGAQDRDHDYKIVRAASRQERAAPQTLESRPVVDRRLQPLLPTAVRGPEEPLEDPVRDAAPLRASHLVSRAEVNAQQDPGLDDLRGRL